MRYSLIISVVAAALFACTVEDPAYIEKMEDWRAERLAHLKTPEGWLSVVGLFWLKDGRQYFGSSKEVNEMPWRDGLPSTIGRFDLDGDSVVCWMYPNLGIKINGVDSHRVKMVSDVEGDKTIINWRNYFWHLIKRQDRYGIRLIDTLSPARLSLEEIPHFPLDSRWIIEAQVLKPKEGQTMHYENVVGMQFDRPILAVFKFPYKGKTHELWALDSGDDRYFLILGDETNGESSYGGGRYLYPDISSSEDGHILLDFNKLENPPCVFTDYATCPLPPRENKLPFRIPVGEKAMDLHQ